MQILHTFSIGWGQASNMMENLAEKQNHTVTSLHLTPPSISLRAVGLLGLACFLRRQIFLVDEPAVYNHTIYGPLCYKA